MPKCVGIWDLIQVNQKRKLYGPDSHLILFLSPVHAGINHQWVIYFLARFFA